MPMWTFLGTLEIEASLRGTAYAATGVAAIISPFIVGMVADRFFPTQKVYGWLHILGGACLLLLGQASDWESFYPFLLLKTVFFVSANHLESERSAHQRAATPVVWSLVQEDDCVPRSARDDALHPVRGAVVLCVRLITQYGAAGRRAENRAFARRHHGQSHRSRGPRKGHGAHRLRAPCVRGFRAKGTQ